MKMKEASSDCLVQDDVVDDDHLLLSRLLSQVLFFITPINLH